METTYVDPLIPLDETGEKTLTRLSTNLGTLTGLINDAERQCNYYLAAMFNRARDMKVEQSEIIITRLTAGDDETANGRRFLLVRDPAPMDAMPMLSHRVPMAPPLSLALTL